jgi:protoheme ferro-lyase
MIEVLLKMDFLLWMAIAILTALTGICLVQYLVSSPSRMHLFLIRFLVLLGGSIVWAVLFFDARQSFTVIILGLICFSGGYLAATKRFLSRQEKRTLPAITRTPGGNGLGHTAVIYFTHGEPPAYDPAPWLETIREFDHDRVPFIPFPFRPFFFHAVRKEYLQAGGSPHNEIHRAIFHELQNSFTDFEKAGFRFYLAFLDSNPRPDEMAIQAINDGAKRIILLPIFITISSHTLAGQEMVAALEPEKYGVQVTMAEPLWNSSLLREHFIKKAEITLGDMDKDQVGILLVGHGQPKAWDQIYPSQTEQENLYRDEIKKAYIRQGYTSENIFSAWMSFKSPSIIESLHALAKKNISKILVFSASISAASIHSEVDVPDAIKKAGISEHIQVINMGAFGDPQDKLIISAIREKMLNVDQS